MDAYLLRVAIDNVEGLPPCYIYGLDYYIPLSAGKDDFSKKLNYFYKYGKNSKFFLKNLYNLYNLRFNNDIIKFDYFSLYPTHEKNCVNPYMRSLAQNLCKKNDIEFKQVICRKLTIKKMHDLGTYEERKENVRGSIEVIEDIDGKNVLLFDNATITGISLIFASNFLLEHGAENVACICLGLGYINKENDFQNLDITMKHSDVIKKN